MKKILNFQNISVIIILSIRGTFGTAEESSPNGRRSTTYNDGFNNNTPETIGKFQPARSNRRVRYESPENSSKEPNFSNRNSKEFGSVDMEKEKATRNSIERRMSFEENEVFQKFSPSMVDNKMNPLVKNSRREQVVERSKLLAEMEKNFIGGLSEKSKLLAIKKNSFGESTEKPNTFENVIFLKDNALENSKSLVKKNSPYDQSAKINPAENAPTILRKYSNSFGSTANEQIITSPTSTKSPKNDEKYTSRAPSEQFSWHLIEERNMPSVTYPKKKPHLHEASKLAGKFEKSMAKSLGHISAQTKTMVNDFKRSDANPSHWGKMFNEQKERSKDSKRKKEEQGRLSEEKSKNKQPPRREVENLEDLLEAKWYGSNQRDSEVSPMKVKPVVKMQNIKRHVLRRRSPERNVNLSNNPNWNGYSDGALMHREYVTYLHMDKTFTEGFYFAWLFLCILYLFYLVMRGDTIGFRF